MQIGFCGKPAAAAQAAAARFDYLELPVNLIAGQTEAEFEETKAAVLSAGIPTPAFNLLFPKDMALLSGDMTDEKIGLYLERAFERVQALGSQGNRMSRGTRSRSQSSRGLGSSFSSVWLSRSRSDSAPSAGLPSGPMRSRHTAPV